jgi:hypothetical protein
MLLGYIWVISLGIVGVSGLFAVGIRFHDHPEDRGRIIRWMLGVVFFLVAIAEDWPRKFLRAVLGP